MSTDNSALVAIAKALQNPIPEAVKKAFTSPTSATSGLAQYNLEPGARTMFPTDTPLRNMIPRKVGEAGIQANWRSITAVNPNGESIGVSEGNRGGYNSYTESDHFAKFVELGMEDYVTWKAERAAGTFQNIDELATQLLLQATMLQEERVMLGGFGCFGSSKLGVTPTPTVAVIGSGGTIPIQTGLLTCVAITYTGVTASSVAAGVKIPYTRTNADGSTDLINGFEAQPSAAAAASTTVANSSITATVPAVPGAFGYAWYFGVAGSQLLAAITTINSVKLTAPAAGTQNLSVLPAADTSNNDLVFDGLIAQTVASGSGGYFKALATGTPGVGTKLTSAGNGTGSITEFDDAIVSFFDNHKLIPTDCWISGKDSKAIKDLILAGNTNLQPFFTDTSGNIRAGARVRTYTNPIGYGVEDIKLHVHPWLPQGTVLFTTAKLPYALSNVTNVMKMNLRRDYYSILWPLRSRKHEYGVYFDGVLQHYFPASMGVLTNIAP